MKKIILLLGICLSLLSKEIIVLENEYNMLLLEKKVKKIVVGSKEIVNVSLLDDKASLGTLLKLFGKKSGNTSLLIVYEDQSVENHQVYVNQNLGYIQKMINIIEPNILLSRIGDGSTVISGEFSDPHQKKRVYSLLESADINVIKVMDVTKTNKVNKMIRTKLYLVEINNQKAKDLGGVTGLGFFSKYTNIAANADAATGVTFSGFLLDNMSKFSTHSGNSVVGTLNFLQEKGIANILDDTVLLTTEDKNASFRVGGEVYIPTGLRDNGIGVPTIELEEKKYGLSLTLNTYFMEKENFMHVNIDIEDSEFDTTKEHNVRLGEFTEVPSFISKNIKTNIIAQSGQVIALGGRLHKETFQQEEKVPFLGDIPLLGELFKRKNSGEKNNDILFFLVPEIVDANKDLDDTNYYEEFKNSNPKLHESIKKVEDKIKVSVNEEAQEPLAEQKSLIKQDALAKEEKSSIQIIEISSENDLENKESVFLEKEKVQEIAIKQSIQNSDNNEKLYEIAVGKIFLRKSPIEGGRAFVWKEGHKFKISDTQNIGESIWFKIKADCLNECLAVDQELWISEKYTREL